MTINDGFLSSIILKVWRGDQWIVYYVGKLTLLSIILQIYTFIHSTRTTSIASRWQRLQVNAMSPRPLTMRRYWSWVIPMFGQPFTIEHNVHFDYLILCPSYIHHLNSTQCWKYLIYMNSLTYVNNSCALTIMLPKFIWKQRKT